MNNTFLCLPYISLLKWSEIYRSKVGYAAPSLLVQSGHPKTFLILLSPLIAFLPANTVSMSMAASWYETRWDSDPKYPCAEACLLLKACTCYFIEFTIGAESKFWPEGHKQSNPLELVKHHLFVNIEKYSYLPTKLFIEGFNCLNLGTCSLDSLFLASLLLQHPDVLSLKGLEPLPTSQARLIMQRFWLAYGQHWRQASWPRLESQPQALDSSFSQRKQPVPFRQITIGEAALAETHLVDEQNQLQNLGSGLPRVLNLSLHISLSLLKACKLSLCLQKQCFCPFSVSLSIFQLLGQVTAALHTHIAVFVQRLKLCWNLSLQTEKMYWYLRLLQSDNRPWWGSKIPRWSNSHRTETKGILSYLVWRLSLQPCRHVLLTCKFLAWSMRLCRPARMLLWEFTCPSIFSCMTLASRYSACKAEIESDSQQWSWDSSDVSIYAMIMLCSPRQSEGTQVILI